MKIEDADRLDWAALSDAKTRLRQFADAFRALDVTGSAYEHPWAGVSAARVLPHDSDHIASLASDWANATEELQSKLKQASLPELTAEDVAAAQAALTALDEVRIAAQQADELVSQVEKILGIVIPRTSKGAKDALGILYSAIIAPRESLTIRNNFILTPGAAEWLRHHKDRLWSARKQRDRLRTIFREEAFAKSADDLEEWSAALNQKGILVRFKKRWRSALSAWDACARPAHLKLTPTEKAANFTALRQFLLDLSALQSDRTVKERLGETGRDLTSDLEGAIAVADWVEKVRSTLSDRLFELITRCEPSSIEALRQLPNDTSAAALAKISGANLDKAKTTFWKALVTSSVRGPIGPLAADISDENTWRNFLVKMSTCSQAAELAHRSEQLFISATSLDQKIWFGGKRPDLAGIASRARLAATNSNLLPKWLDFDRFHRASQEAIERNLIRAAATGEIDSNLLELQLDFLVFDSLARKAFTESPHLLSLSGKSLDALREDYRSLDAQVMELRRAVIAAKLLQKRPPEGRQSGLKSELTEMALLRAELAKQRRHIPIRQLVARAGRTLQALKPCFMMGPLSVAQYIAPGTLKFDLIIMDEASQMRPEDAIGALARGGQAVIVGDPKQLPPTSFFDRVANRTDDDDDDSDVTIAEDSKSILELSSSIFDQRMLRWHYRSRHESLIAFSNRHFYKDELIIFPSPAGQEGRFGIGWNFIANGTTTKGVNPIEARAVAEAASKFLVEHKSRSLGIVAMNIKQAQRISDELSALADRDPALAKALAEAEDEAGGEPFFVKNLENVQGDERDIIMISMTYGPASPDGRTPQNFGPINQETGWRRLNVLFTRAKERMEIFSSMRATDVVPKEGGDRGPRSLKLFLEYAETGSLGIEPRPTGRDSDSDFEDAVFEGLSELNFECVRQVGVANFFLDIGVKNPLSPNDFIAAIECDGAAYHSTKSARDRDRLRQEILENLGWNIIRIWSTDWFRDPNAELDRVSGELKRLISSEEERRARKTEEHAPTETSAAKPKAEPNVTLKNTDLFGDTPSAPPTPPKILLTGISIEQARAKLVDLRERSIKARYPESDPTTGFLRKSMLDELLRKRPTDMDEFRRVIRLDLRQKTDPAQVKEFSEKVFDILAEIVS